MRMLIQVYCLAPDPSPHLAVFGYPQCTSTRLRFACATFSLQLPYQTNARQSTMQRVDNMLGENIFPCRMQRGSRPAHDGEG